jgi:thiamine pyrophosphokinase
MTNASWLIVANGEKLSAQRLHQLAAGRSVLACDGAVDDCLQHGITPDIVLGDFDSWTAASATPPRSDKIEPTIIHTPDQNKTDSEKALLHLIEQNASDIILCQAMGDRTDHSLINLGLLSRYHDSITTLTIAREHESIRYVKNDRITIKGNIGDRIAVLGFPAANVSSQGLAYECHQFEISIAGQSSGCNRLKTTDASIEVNGSALITVQI